MTVAWTPHACQDMVDHIVPPGCFSELRHLPNADFLTQYNINLARQMAMGSQLRPRFKQEARLLKKAKAQVARWDQRIQVREEEIKRLDLEIKSLKTVEMEVHGLRNQAKNLETLLEAEVDIKKATEAKNVGLAKELESLPAFEEFKKYEDDKVKQRCAEMDDRLNKLNVDFDEELQAFADVVSAGLAKGMSEGLKYGAEHGKAGRDLADIEAYDLEANSKLVKALQDLKDLKYSVMDQMERLNDAPMKLIMASLHLESDTRSDGIPVSAHAIVPHGLAILLADAATQTEAADKEEEPHPRLQRLISLPHVYNL
ncbi:hypothetical protein Tco_0309539 [Tanacetum coccineum]